VSLSIGAGWGDNPHLCAVKTPLPENEVTTATLHVKQGPSDPSLLQIGVGNGFPSGEPLYSEWISHFDGVYASASGQSYGGRHAGAVAFTTGDLVEVEVDRRMNTVCFSTKRGRVTIQSVRVECLLSSSDPRIFAMLGGSSETKIEVEVRANTSVGQALEVSVVSIVGEDLGTFSAISNETIGNLLSRIGIGAEGRPHLVLSSDVLPCNRSVASCGVLNGAQLTLVMDRLFGWDPDKKQSRLELEGEGYIVSLSIGAGWGDNPHLCAVKTPLPENEVTTATLHVKQGPSDPSLLQIGVGNGFPSGEPLYSEWISHFDGVYASASGQSYGGRHAGAVAFTTGDLVEVEVDRRMNTVCFSTKRGRVTIQSVRVECLLSSSDPRIFAMLGGSSWTKIEVEVVHES